MSRALTVLLAVGALAGVAAPAASAPTRTIEVGDDYFVREGKAPTVTVTRNTSVRWRFQGDSFHDVTVTRGPVKFRSRAMNSGTYAKRVTRRGDYRIICTIHGATAQSMTLRVK